MYRSIIKGDFLKSKVASLITILFVTCSAMLVSLAIVLSVNLLGAIDTLMTKAKTPHFMQMHSGDLDIKKLRDFANQNHMVRDFQVLEFLNVDGAKIITHQNSLADSVQDNGFSVQSEKFDYLLDLDGEVITVRDGEIYVPIVYMKDGTIKIGDQVTVGKTKLIVSGFLRDSQMNSNLCLSKRFLISQKDYDKIKQYGNVEYLIEFRLKDLRMLSSFENAYILEGLDANGPTITYPLFKMINGISDGIMIAIILLISLLVVIVSLLCIRFTLLSKIEEEYQEIGGMKAIGLRIWDIKKIYLVKYALIAGLGSVLGFIVSLMFKGILLENIRLFMGEAKSTPFALIFEILGVFWIFFIIMAYVNGVLKQFRRISVVKAIRFGANEDSFTGAGNLWFSKNKLLPTNVFLGIKDVLTRKKLYMTMLIVLALCLFIMIVPKNLYTTVSSKNFIRYMGIGNCAIRIDIQQTHNILEKTIEAQNQIKHDKDVSKYALFITKAFEIKTKDGSKVSIKVELGNHSIFPIEYTKGKMPEQKNEIALSVINADELGKEVGDNITLFIDGKEKDFTVSGIYSDVTNGGKTAKAVFEDNSSEIMWSVINIELKDQSLLEKKVMEYTRLFNYAKVYDINTYISKVFGQVISSVNKAAYGGFAISLIMALLITL
jgi:putative ABC transport system permease protein